MNVMSVFRTDDPPAGRHRSGATETGPTTHQIVGVSGVLCLLVVLAIIVAGAAARVHADGVRAEALAQNSETGVRLATARAETHEVDMLTRRYFEAYRVFVESARRYGAVLAEASSADTEIVDLLTEGAPAQVDRTMAIADGPLRDLEAARIALVDARTRLRDERDTLSRAVEAASPALSPG